MKNYFLCFFFVLCLYGASSEVSYAQSIGFSMTNTYARVNQLSFDKQAIDIEAYQVRDLGSHKDSRLFLNTLCLLLFAYERKLLIIGTAMN